MHRLRLSVAGQVSTHEPRRSSRALWPWSSLLGKRPAPLELNRGARLHRARRVAQAAAKSIRAGACALQFDVTNQASIVDAVGLWPPWKWLSSFARQKDRSISHSRYRPKGMSV